MTQLANHKSAVKRAQQAEVRRQRNQAVKSTVKTAARKVLTAVQSQDAASAEEALRSAFSRIDKAKSKGVLHPRTAARRKARLAKKVAAVAAQATTQS